LVAQAGEMPVKGLFFRIGVALPVAGAVVVLTGCGEARPGVTLRSDTREGDPVRPGVLSRGASAARFLQMCPWNAGTRGVYTNCCDVRIVKFR